MFRWNPFYTLLGTKKNELCDMGEKFFSEIKIFLIYLVSDAPPSNDFSKRNLIHIFDTLYTTIPEFDTNLTPSTFRIFFKNPLYALI